MKEKPEKSTDEQCVRERKSNKSRIVAFSTKTKSRGATDSDLQESVDDNSSNEKDRPCPKIFMGIQSLGLRKRTTVIDQKDRKDRPRPKIHMGIRSLRMKTSVIDFEKYTIKQKTVMDFQKYLINEGDNVTPIPLTRSLLYI